MSRSDCVSVGSVLDRLFARGELPERVELLRDRDGFPWLRAGECFSWSDELRGYVREYDQRFVFLAGVVRLDWGWAFGPSPEQQQLIGVA